MLQKKIRISYRALSLLMALCLLLSMSACGKDSGASPLELASAAAEGTSDGLELRSALPGSDAYETYISSVYGLPEGCAEDGAILAAGGSRAFEIAVLKISKTADTREVKSVLDGYIKGRTMAFAGYFPEEEQILKGSKAVIKKGYALLLICSDPSSAEAAFGKCLKNGYEGDLPEYMPMEREGGQSGDDQVSWTYDEDRILKAWQSGDWSGLHEKDEAILTACRELLDKVTKPGQSEAQLEFAVHAYLYDFMEYDVATVEGYGGIPDPDNDNPYGALIGGKGICEGYTRTFQLLMDICRIECISVFGHSDNGQEYGEHAWNQVRLDGEWYIVDVTWDDPVSSMGVVPERYHYRYFNVTSADIASNHFWDRESVPEATGTKYNWDYFK